MKRTALVLLAGFALVAGASQARAQQAPADHLLISEVAYDAITESSQSSNSEYVEIFNPTAFPIDLSRVYLTDDPNRYVSITDPLNAPPNAQRPSVDSSDFMYRFPDGSQLRPGEIAVVTTDSDVFFTDMGFIDAADFLTSTGAQLFEVVQDTDAVPNMSVEHNLTTAGGTTLPKFSLTNSGELITLFTWDGQSALIQDLDSVTWGPVTKTLSSGVIPNVIDKTNEVAHDGTAYQTDNGSQHPNLDALKVPRNGSSTLDPKSIHRVRLDEVGEQLTGGNGENGHDESTEDWLQTFEIRSMNPGEVPFGAPAVAIDPTIDFGGVAFGQTEAFEVTIENTGQVALLVSDIRLAPAAGQQSVPAEYTVDASGVPLVLGAGESMTRDITFTADINFPGVRAVDLVVVTNDPVHAVCVIPTTAEAVEPAEIAVNPDTIIFASTLVSNTREETFTISNVGQSDLHINAITFDDAQFSLLEPDAFVIAPGDSAVRTVQFAPAQETDVTATLTIASNDPNAAQSQITLIGTSVDLGRSPSSCSVSKSGSAPAGAPLLALALGLFGMAWVRRSRRVTA